MTILDQPIRVDREAERISVFNGSASLAFNGNEQLRREAMRFYEQAPAAFRLLIEMAAGDSCESTMTCAMARYGQFEETRECALCRARTVLRDAGVLP